jgi:hypothetical protein
MNLRRALSHLAVVAAIASCATAEKREGPPRTSGPENAAPAPSTDTPMADEEPDLRRNGLATGRADGERRDVIPSRPLPADVESMREAVRGAGISRERPAQVVARALRAIAGVIQRVAREVPAAPSAIDGMLGEIRSLEDLGAVDLDRADRVKAALEQGVEATRAVARHRSALEEWVDAAAASVEGIDAATPLGLQRAPVQDALRALADAVAVAAGRAGVDAVRYP